MISFKIDETDEDDEQADGFSRKYAQTLPYWKVMAKVTMTN